MSKWWDGYDGERCVLIEDVDKSHTFLGYFLKIWADHYPFPAECKGSKTAIRPQRIIVTSNYAPDEIWTDLPTLEPIMRRFKVYELTETYCDIKN